MFLKKNTKKEKFRLLTVTRFPPFDRFKLFLIKEKTVIMEMTVILIRNFKLENFRRKGSRRRRNYFSFGLHSGGYST